MIKTDNVIEYFDKLAPTWDDELIRVDETVAKILKNAEIGAGTRVLDVACGTGVLFPDYLKLGAKVVGVDISPEMCKIAQEKFKDEDIDIVCGDVESLDLGEEFDCCMVYNAFPHFPDPERLIKCLAGKLRENGRLSIAHGLSRDRINHIHSGSASAVSNGLMSAEELKKMFEPYFDVDIVISDDKMYQVSGKKK